MRVPLLIASIACSLIFSPAVQARAPQAGQPVSSKEVVIRVEGAGWGTASQEEIETVLYAVADELLTRIPKKLSVPIVVTHTDRNPIALYDKGSGGEYLVRLHARDKKWPQFAYEFAHELCHIMSNYEQNVGSDITKYNQWFEETLCEAASLYALRSMAQTWRSAAPNPEWARFAPALQEFADRLEKEGHRKLPANTPLAVWLEEHEAQMRQDPYLREKNEVVASLLLPLFAENPEHWDTLSYLNLDPADARNSLRQYLRNWYMNAPAEHKRFIASVLTLLGVSNVIMAEMSGAVPADATPAVHGATLPGQAGPLNQSPR